MRSLLFLPLVLLFAAEVLPAQLFTFGVRAGVPLNDDLDTVYATSESKRVAVGPMVTAKLPLSLGLEFDALYRRDGYRSPGSDIIGDVYTISVRGNSWEFPILIRRALRHGVYAAVGYAPRVINGSGHVVGLFTTSLSSADKVYREYDIPGGWRTTHGVIGALGIDRHLGPLHIAPELRYTYWTNSALDVSGPQGFSIRSSQHQVDFLVGLAF